MSEEEPQPKKCLGEAGRRDTHPALAWRIGTGDAFQKKKKLEKQLKHDKYLV